MPRPYAETACQTSTFDVLCRLMTARLDRLTKMVLAALDENADDELFDDAIIKLLRVGPSLIAVARRFARQGTECGEHGDDRVRGCESCDDLSVQAALAAKLAEVLDG